MEQESHLGGYLNTRNFFGDPGTWSPEIWDKIIEKYGVKSVLDIGCGMGYSTRYFGSKGLHAVGVEGGSNAIKNSVHPLITQHDYTKGPAPLDQEIFDLVWCCEFVEHVEEKYRGNFLKDFCRGKVIAMTFANVDQPGYHHVNCQPQKYWVEKIESIGYKFNDALSENLRKIASISNDPQYKPFQHGGHLTKLMIFERDLCRVK